MTRSRAIALQTAVRRRSGRCGTLNIDGSRAALQPETNGTTDAHFEGVPPAQKEASMSYFLLSLGEVLLAPAISLAGLAILVAALRPR